MSEGVLIQLGRDALLMVLLISAPMLGLGLLVGVIVSIFQATTQIQEATLAFVPKIVAVFIGIVVFGPWMLHLITGFTTQLYSQVPYLIK
jgi:flagellar biosynthetic protein FliQ